MSAVSVPAVMCDDEMGCGDYVHVSMGGDAPPIEWGISTRDICTEHLCWDCVYAANDDFWIERGHYLSAPTTTLPTPTQGETR